MSNSLNIIYEDNHVIVIEKPVNVLSQGDNTNDLSIVDILKQYLKQEYNKQGNVYLGLVHRLDRPVGGLMVLAKTSKAAKRLSEQLSDRTLCRKYLAICQGEIKQACQLINYIEQDSKGFMVETEENNPKAQKAVLNLLPLCSKCNTSLLCIELKTGKKHQIRVQLSLNNHPILCDMRYNTNQIKGQIALWSFMLSFIHPTTKQAMQFVLKPNNASFNTYNTEIDNYITSLNNKEI